MTSPLSRSLLLGFFFLCGAFATLPCVFGQSPAPAFAQSQLPRTTLQINGHDLEVEIAATPESMSQGLMFRDSLPANNGMLFVFPTPHQASFWMKNTRIPLSIAYLDKDGKIVEIHPLIPFEETAVKSKSDRICYALEVNRDWFSTRNIKPGTQIQNLPVLKKQN